MTIKEKLDIARVVVSTIMLVISGYMATNHIIDWGWFLFAGIFIYPTHINIDFKERITEEEKIIIDRRVEQMLNDEGTPPFLRRQAD